MLGKEFLENIIKKQLQTTLESLEFLEKRNNNEEICLTLLSSNMKSIESNY
jgi:hypothetical protein